MLYENAIREHESQGVVDIIKSCINAGLRTVQPVRHCEYCECIVDGSRVLKAVDKNGNIVESIYCCELDECINMFVDKIVCEYGYQKITWDD